MPRIDPIQLLNCLSVLLSPSGGIKSRDEVQRLANLMTRFSKKLVSKCIYVQILKCTETDLLGLFMGSGGWTLVHTWLSESIVIKNWPLLRELLELLLLCPVDIECLKTNNCPKLVKELSKEGNHFDIRALASKLVEQWLKIVKGVRIVPVTLTDLSQIITEAKYDECSYGQGANGYDSEDINVENNVKTEVKTDDNIESDTDADALISAKDKNNSEDKNKENSAQESEGLLVLKISLKDGKQIVSKVEDNDKLSDSTSDTEKSKEKHKSKSKEKSSEKSSSSNSSKSSSSKRSSRSHSSDKHKSSHKSSSSSSRHSSKDKTKEKSSHSSKSKSDSSKKSNVKSSSSSIKSKDEKNSKYTSEKEKKEKENKDKEKNKTNTNEKSDDKPQVPSIHKLGKIPKLSDVKREKPSISIEIRKPDEPKPKTVKTFHSKFRKHGLEEEVKPPPSRASLLNKKVPPALPPTVVIPKRPSPVHNESPPEKKPKTTEIVEKPGAIKLIPPKPKRSPWCLLLLLVSSSVFNSIGFYSFGVTISMNSHWRNQQKIRVAA